MKKEFSVFKGIEKVGYFSGVELITKNKDLILKKVSSLQTLGFQVVSGGHNPFDTQEIILENDFLKLDINFYVAVDQTKFSIYVTKKGHNAGFTFDEYLKYKRIAGDKKRGDETTEHYIERYLTLLIHHLSHNET